MDDRRHAADPVDGAAFSGRLGGSRPPITAAAVVVIVGTIVVAGLFGDDGAADAARPTNARATAAPIVREPPLRSRPIRASLLALDVHATGQHLFVHGEVFTLDAVVVQVTVRNGSGRTIGEERVEIQGGSTAFRLGAETRFQAAFLLEAGTLPGSGWITAIALDATGDWVATERAPLPRPREASLRWVEAGT